MILKVRLEAMLKNKKLYPNAKNVKQRFIIAKKYFLFLGKRSKIKDEKDRKTFISISINLVIVKKLITLNII